MSFPAPIGPSSAIAALLHRRLIELDVEPAFSLGEVVFYNTKTFFKKHNFGRDVKRFVAKNDWCVYNNKYHLNARGIITLGFAKKNQLVLDLIWKLLELPFCNMNLEMSQLGIKVEEGQQEDEGDGEGDGEAEEGAAGRSKNPAQTAPSMPALQIPIPMRDSPRSIGSFESPRTPNSGGMTPNSAPSRFDGAFSPTGRHTPMNFTVTSARQPTTSSFGYTHSGNSGSGGGNSGGGSSSGQGGSAYPPHFAPSPHLVHAYPHQSHMYYYNPQSSSSQSFHPPSQGQVQSQGQGLGQGQGQGQGGGGGGGGGEGPPAQKRPLPEDFEQQDRQKRMSRPTVIPLDFSLLQPRESVGSSDRSLGDMSLERSHNFFMMMPEELITLPTTDYTASYPIAPYLEYHDTMVLDSPNDPNRRMF